MKKIVLVALAIGGLLLLMVPLLSGLAKQASPAGINSREEAFARVWNRTDKPLEEIPGLSRSFIWGPPVATAASITQEAYNGATRPVQYFDKARMEINNPAASPVDPYYVTTGLLVKELVTGIRQDGDNSFTPLQPSTAQVAGDPNDNGANPLAPTYASFKNVVTFQGSENGRDSAPGSLINSRIDKAGQVYFFSPPESRQVAAYDEITHHNIADVFADFGNQQGQIWNGSQYVTGPLFYPDATYVLGRPVTEPYWVTAVVAGKEQAVLVQLFERRVLTYTPDNPAAFKVELGNVGQHYFKWRYNYLVVNNPTLAPPQNFSATSLSGQTSSPAIPTPAAAQLSSFPVGAGLSDVIPHQIVRTAADKLYIFGIQDNYSNNIAVYWTTTTGLPVSAAAFSGSLTQAEAEKPISIAPVYDGASLIHVLVNTHSGNLKDYVFNTGTNTFKSPITIAVNSATITGDYIGTSGISGMFDTGGVLQLAYWTSGKHITYSAYTYNSGANTLTVVPGSTLQLDSSGAPNHPSLAISPKDGSITVAWITAETNPAQLVARTKPAGGSWGGLETLSTGPLWTSTNFGVNIDQGPSFVIDPAGTRHLAYIENFDNTAEYGRIHYISNSGSGWVDTPLDTYTHDPALALNSSGELYIIGHGHPNNRLASTGCLSMDVMCYIKKNSNGSWTQQAVIATPPASYTYDGSPSIKWSVVGFNRPETIEFVFFSALKANYSSMTLNYGYITSSTSNPAPTITGLTPQAVTMNTTGFNLTVAGSNFLNDSVVKYSGSNRTTTFTSSSQLSAQILTSDLQATGAFTITVYNPTEGTTSNSVFFYVVPDCNQVINNLDTLTCGTLRYAVANSGGLPVVIATGGPISLTAPLTVPDGVQILGSCSSKLQLNLSPANPLTLLGNNLLKGLNIHTGKPNSLVLPHGKRIQFQQCVTIIVI